MLFPKVKDKNCSNFQLNKDLNKMSKWVFQWKTFQDVANKPNICCFHKFNTENHPLLMFNDTKVQLATIQKHFELILY